MEIFFRKLSPFSSLIIIFLLFIVSFLLFSRNISSPGIQYDEALFINGALGFKFAWFKHLSLMGVPIYVFPYIGSLKSLFYTPIFEIFGVNPASIRIPALLVGMTGIYLPLIVFRRKLSFIKILIYSSILLSCSNLFLLSRNDWGPVSINILLSSIIYLIIFFKKDYKKNIWSISVSFLCLLLVFNKLDAILIVISLSTTLIINQSIKYFFNKESGDSKNINQFFKNVFSDLIIFLPSISLFLIRFFYIKNSFNNTNVKIEKGNLINYSTKAIKNFLDPFELDLYFYDVTQKSIDLHFYIYLALIIFAIIFYLRMNLLKNNKYTFLLSKQIWSLILISLLNMIIIYIIPLQTSIHHNYMSIYPLLIATSLILFDLSDYLIFKKNKIIFFIAITLITSNLIFNINGLMFHFRQINLGSYSRTWNNEIYKISDNFDRLLSNERTFSSSIFSGWGYINQIEAFNEEKIIDKNYSSIEIHKKPNLENLLNYHNKFLEMIKKHPEIKTHQIIIAGNNNFLETDNSCSENYYYDFLQIPNYKGNKYEPDLMNSKMMKNSYICSFNLKID